jgi:hypothetical protein
VKVLLVPWFKPATGFTLRVYGLENHCKVEISTFRGQELALTLIQKYSESLLLSTFNVKRSLRMAVVAEVSDAVAERLLFALSKLGEVQFSRLIPSELVENPSIKGLERFLSIRKLVC